MEAKSYSGFSKSLKEGMSPLATENIKKKKAYKWYTDKRSLYAHSPKKRSQLEFTNLDADGYFELMSISYQGKKNQSYKINKLRR